MAKRGPKSKPIEARVIEGNRSNKPLPEPISVPKQVRPPSPPSHLTQEAKTEWRRLALSLHKLGLLTKLDRAVFAAYCQAYGDWVSGQKMLNDLKKKGSSALLSKTSNGNIIQNPLVGVVNTARREMTKAAAELGLTPSSRTQIANNGPKTSPSQNKEGKATGRFFGSK